MKKQDLKHIAIVGGGPGGLMLGLLLQRQGFSFTIYERGYQNMHSDRGGSLDIHDDSGQLPLKEAGIFENFRKHARYEGEDTRIVNKDGEILYDEDAEGEGNRPEIDRGKLCDIIMEQIHPENIKYGFKFEKLIQRDNGEVELVFENGTTVMTNLVIGADGAFSQIRSYLTNAKPEYTGISMIEMNSDENEHPDLLKFNKNGKLIGLGGDQAILGQRNGDGRIMAYISFKTKYEKLDEYDSSSEESMQYVASYCCFAPADDPEVILLVMADEPDKSINYYGGSVAAPYARNIMEDVLPYLGFYHETSNIVESNNVTVPMLQNKSIEEAKSILAELGLSCEVVGNGSSIIRQCPATGFSIEKSGIVLLYTDDATEPQYVEVPDLLGKTAVESEEALREAGLNLVTIGASAENSGAIVQFQSEQAGSSVEKGTVITLTMVLDDQAGW